MTSEEAVASTLQRLSLIPGDADVSLVIRHAEREEIPTATFGFHVALTAAGISAAEQMGKALSARGTITAVSSPIPRCVQTAQAILRAEGCPTTLVTDNRLGDPGAFILEPESAGATFLDLPVGEIARRQLQAPEPPPGMRRTEDGVAILLDLVAGDLGRNGRLNVYVTHDVILAVLVGSILRSSLEDTGWPGFLEGLLLWRVGGRLHCSWRRLTALYPTQ